MKSIKRIVTVLWAIVLCAAFFVFPFTTVKVKAEMPAASGTYKIYFDGNGGYFDGDQNTVAGPYEVAAGEEINLYNYGYATHPTDDFHHMQIGWRKGSPNGEFFSRDAWDTPTGDTTYYAEWADCYLITFVSDDSWNSFALAYAGDGAITQVEYGKVISTGRYGVPDFFPWDAVNEIRDESRAFAGWYTEPNGGGDKIDVNTYIPTSDVRLYPYAVPNYTVTFDANGGFFSGNSGAKTQTEKYAEGSLVTDGPMMDTNADSVFNGWYFDAACTQKIPEDGLTVTSDVTLYAGYGDYWTITLDAGEGQLFSYGVATMTAPTRTQTIKVAKGNRLGHLGWRWNAEMNRFSLRWYQDEGLTIPYYDDDDAMMNFRPVSDMTLYPEWSKTTSFNLNANSSTAFFDIGETQSSEYYYSLVLWYDGGHLEEELPRPVNTDSTLLFLGYYFDAACTKKYNGPEDIPDSRSGLINGLAAPPTDLYAKWGSDTQIFSDVQNSTVWYYNTIYQIARTTNAKGHALMSGYKDGSGNFGPADPLTRQDFAVILYRLADEPPVKLTNNPFPDADRTGYYFKSIFWAKETGLISGYENGRFGVGDNITREQVATILYRYAKDYLKIDITGAEKAGNLELFEDAQLVSPFASDALKWANGAGVISGKDNGSRIDPQGNAARAEIGAMVLRFIEYSK